MIILQLCLYCQSVLWGEPHEECDRQFCKEQDLLDKAQHPVDYDWKGDPYKDTSDDQPDCPPEDPYENVPNEDPEGEEDYPDSGDEEEDVSPPPAHEPVFRIRTCEGCGKQFETSNGSKLCYDCTLKEICAGNPPETADMNTAEILSGSRNAQAVRAELRDYI